ncbi:MAG: VCBS repeat-containing protein [Bacteroidia bacterium]|nr:VCBS repeat-containing protein [Bacteroidia bacterium]
MNNLLHSETGAVGSNANVRSGNSVAVVDVNNDGLDDIVKLDGNRYVRIEYQQVGGTFNHVNVGDFGVTSGWGMSLADVDHNGYKDILYAGWGSGGALLMKLNNTGTGVLTAPYTLPGGGGIAGQNCNFMDVNNDGWEDIFVCNDVNESMIWVNDGAGNFPAEANNTAINFDVTAGTAAPNDESGNYGSVWTDFDNDGDVDFYVAHCRQSYGPGDIRRTNRLFQNNGNGTYTENAAAHGLASNDQDWTAAFGDIDNDGDFDCFMTKHDVISRYYINNNGNFTVSPNTISFGSMPMQSQFEDMDNDGFVDLVISGDNDERIYRNNQNGTFTDVTPTNISNGGNMLSFASGDLNHDGKIDLYASYGSTYNNPGSTDDIYWQNSSANSNHFLTLALTGTISTKGGLGARAFIYGAWGVQTREVRASESYGTLNSFQLHFGLGAATTIDSVVVNWPSGVQTVIVTPAADQFLNVIEVNPCTLTSASISPSGPTTFCTGGSVTLSAPIGSGYTYLWSNGATTQSINVNSSGSYAVTVSESAMCNSTSPSIVVAVNPSETPAVTASSNVVSCPGTVTLTSTPAASYLWSTGATTQSIVVMTSGNYSVTIQGTCQAWSSTTTSVTTLAAPATPSGSDVGIPTPQSVVLTATGTADVWFDAPTGGVQLGTGNNYTTPVVSSDTTFYVEDQQTNGGSTGAVGQTFNSYSSGNGFSGGTTNAWDIFDVIAPCTLSTVKVYTDTPGNRLIELRNSAGTVLLDTLVNIPVDTSIVTLNWPLTVGTAYQLGTNTAQNQTLLGTNSPRLKRSNSNVSYPYNLSGLVSVTGSNQGSGFFYYFYDWQITTPAVVCASPRWPISVYMTTGVNSSNVANEMKIFPNPASSSVNVKLNSAMTGNATVQLVDLAGRLVKNVGVSTITKDQLIAVDLSSVSAGVYFIKVVNNGKQMTAKLVVE